MIRRTEPIDAPWREQAACRGKDPEIFYPEAELNRFSARAAAAAENEYARTNFCRTCPVKQQCLEYALTTNQKFGIWGGMTIEEMRREKRRRKRRKKKDLLKLCS